MLPEAEKQTFKRGKYTIEISPKAQIDLSARVVYMQYNDSLLSSFDYYANPLYDTISPLDVSVFIKSMADNWKEYEVRHEKRLLLIKGQKTIAHEWQNIHIVPANNVIYKGFATVKQGDIIKLKGFLIDWTGYYNQSQIYAETALSFDSASKERAAGRFTFLCMQFFVTELYANNYLFK